VARYGPGDAAVSYASQALTDVTVIGDIDSEMLLEEITAMGNDDEVHASVGVRRYGPITLSAPYSDDSNLLRDKCDDTGLGGTATLVITFGGSKTFTISTILKSTKRVISRGALTRFEATLQPTGAATEA
jgi:hypothetical protein